MTLARATDSPVSQRFAGSATAEPEGWFINGVDGRPLRASRTPVPKWIYHHDFHQGLDQYGAIGSDLLAIEAGRVISVNRSIGQVVIAFRGHTDSRYSFNHCNSILVSVGASVSKGQHIAEMGKLGNATGSHVHLEISFKSADRWTQWDPARFYPPRSFRFGLPYRADQVAKHACDPDGYLYGGSHLYDEHIYPIRQVTINDGTNVRAQPDTHSAKLLLTTAPTPAVQLNEIPGGEYEIGGVTGTLWAKVKLPIGGVSTTGYVAKPLLKA